MTTLLWILLFAFVLVGGFCAFLLMEFVAIARKDDDLHTLSTYIKRTRRRLGIAGKVLLTTIIVSPAVWLWGHLVQEWW